MRERITNRDLDALVRRINAAVNGDADLKTWNIGLRCLSCGKEPWWSMPREGDPCPDDGGRLAWSNLGANVGVFYVDGAYGGVALYRIVSEGGAVTDVLGTGHVEKRSLYNQMHAFLRGLDFAGEVTHG